MKGKKGSNVLGSRGACANLRDETEREQFHWGIEEVIEPGPQSPKWEWGEEAGGAVGGTREEDLTAKPGHLD